MDSIDEILNDRLEKQLEKYENEFDFQIRDDGEYKRKTSSNSGSDSNQSFNNVESNKGIFKWS